MGGPLLWGGEPGFRGRPVSRGTLAVPDQAATCFCPHDHTRDARKTLHLSHRLKSQAQTGRDFAPYCLVKLCSSCLIFGGDKLARRHFYHRPHTSSVSFHGLSSSASKVVFPCQFCSQSGRQGAGGLTGKPRVVGGYGCSSGIWL